jgi:hypothetical protein
VGDGEVGRENRHGIAKNEVITPIENSFLAFREMIRAEETFPFVPASLTDPGQAAFDSSGVMLEAHGKSSAVQIALPDLLKRFVAFPKIEPRPFLL